MRHGLKALALVVLLAGPMAANAIPITLTFTATNFIQSGGVNPDPSPNPSISGSIVYDAASLGATIDSLTSISLTIGAYSYTLATTSFQSPFGGDIDLIYGALNGTNLAGGTDDFWLRFDRATGTGFDFVYSTAGIYSSWLSNTFSQFALSAASVPEPGTLGLLGLGLAGLGLTRRRKLN